MNKIKRLLPFLPLVFLCGCLQVTDELSIQPDGSGTVKLDIKSSIPGSMAQNIGMGMGETGAVVYPPTSEAEARKFFPGKEFTVTTKEEDNGETGSHLTVTVEFKDINALLSSPYGHAHAL